MTDVFDPAQRSAVMRAVKSRDTGPEMAVRRAAHALGLRFRLHRSDLPGRPDLVFPSRRIALFVHGCFWHGHDCPRGARMPQNNRDYWQAKIGRNMARDKATMTALRKLGWTARTIWECETRDPAALARRITRLVGRARQT
ncbi:MAG: DNA mismatch endonuclease Vsr [Hyphomonadaceae bacterium]